MSFEMSPAEREATIEKMRVSNALIEPTARRAIRALELPAGSRGLDVGCGIGLQTLLIAHAVGPTGHVTGLDVSREFLALAESIIEESDSPAVLSFREGEASNLPFENQSFDWAWSSCCVGYAASIEPRSGVRELARVVKPGGTVALFAWSSETLLPGYPLLEARLEAPPPGIAPFVEGRGPERHFLRALGWFRDAGLEETVARTFAGEAHAPLSPELRAAVVALFEMRWPGVESELTREERAEYRRLCLPESPEFIVDHPDYFGFFTCSMFCGKVPV